MIKRIPTFHTLFLIACILWLTSCSTQVPAPLESTINHTSTSTIHDKGGTKTSTPTPTKGPVDTAVPTPTKWPGQKITSASVGSLREINSWGRGSIMQIQKLDNKQREYLVLTPRGLYWYGSTSPFLLTFISNVDDFVLSPDGRWLAVSKKNGDVEIWDTDSLSLKQSISHVFPEDVVQRIKNKEILPFYVGGMAFAPDGSQMAVGYVDGKIELWRMGEPAPYATFQHDALALWKTDIGLLFQLSFSPDSKILTAFKFAPNINANRLTFWSIPEAKLISVSDAGRYYELPKAPYLQDGKTMIVFVKDDSYLRINLWDIGTGKRINDFDTGLFRIDSTELTPGRDQLTVYGSDTQENNYRQVWALPNGELVESEKLDQLSEDEDLSRFMEFLLEQDHYDNVWGSDDNPGQARLVNEGTMPIQVLEEDYLLTIPDGSIEAARLPEDVTNEYYDPQGKFTAWCEPGKLMIQDKNGAITTTDLPFNSNCDGVVVSSQKHYAALWNNQALYMQDLETGKYSKPVFDRRWSSAPMLTACFSDDEQILITSMTALLTVWQVNPFQKISDSHNENRYIGNNLEIALSKDKSTAVTLSISRGSTSDRASQLLVWRVADSFPLHRINPPFIDNSHPMFTSFALSPEGILIASGDDFGGIRFWSVESGEQLASYDVESRPLDLAFTPDGSGLIVILSDGTTRLFGVP